MEQYAEIIGEDASSDDYYKIATHFDNAGDHFKAGKFYFAAKYYEKVHTTHPYIVDIYSIIASGSAALSSMPHFA